MKREKYRYIPRCSRGKILAKQFRKYFRTLFQLPLFGLVQRNSNYFFDTIATQYTRNAEGNIGNAVVVVEFYREREYFARVVEDISYEFASDGGDGVAGVADVVDDAIGGIFCIVIALVSSFFGKFRKF